MAERSRTWNATIILIRPAKPDATSCRESLPLLLRSNRNFRLLYIGQTISQLGDWFNAVAVYALLLDLTGSATAVAWMMIVQFLPIAHRRTAGRRGRRSRRTGARLMIAADLLRGVPDPRPAAGPARRSGLDRLRRDGADRRRRRRSSSRRAPRRFPTSRRAEELLPANALSSATWSAMLAHRRVDRRPGHGGRRPQRRVRRQRARRSSRRRSSSRRRATTRRPPAGRRAARAGCALTGITDLVEGFRYVRGIVARRGADVRQGRLGPRRRRPAAADDLRPARVSGRRQHGRRHRRALRRARHRRRRSARSRCAGSSGRSRPRCAGPSARRTSSSACSTWRSPARRRCRIAALCVLLRALRRLDPVGVQHGAAADGSAGSLSRPRLRRGARARDADVVGVELLDRLRSSIAPAGRRARSSFALGALFCVPGVLWLLILSRWQESDSASRPDQTASAERN